MPSSLVLLASGCGGSGELATVESEIALPGAGQVAVGSDYVWATSADGSLSRIDPDTDEVDATTKAGGPSVEFAAIDEGAVWISDPDANSVVRVDAETTRVVARIPVGLTPKGGTVAQGSVWVALEHDGAVARIDPERNAVAAKIRVGPEGQNGPLAVASSAGGIWVSVPVGGEVVQIDPKTNRVTRRLPVAQPCVFAATDDDLWLSGCGRTEVTHLDPETGTLSVTADLSPDMPGAPALDAPDLWAVTFMANLVRIDTESRTVDDTMPLQGYDVEGESVAVGFGSLWIRVRDRVLRLGVG